MDADYRIMLDPKLMVKQKVFALKFLRLRSNLISKLISGPQEAFIVNFLNHFSLYLGGLFKYGNAEAAS